VASVADLAALPLFNALDDDQLGELATWFHPESKAEGTRLVGEGAPGYTFFVLTDGTAAVTSEGQSLATLEPGDFFGEIAILGDGRRQRDRYEHLAGAGSRHVWNRVSTARSCTS
jgi:CRP-like cAMP-binding protein